jgi:DNA polymerase III epsilon subunit-like protein
MPKSIFFTDTETSGLALFKQPYTHPDQPWIVQLGGILSSGPDIIDVEFNLIVQPNGRTIHPKALAVHGIDIPKSAWVGAEEQLVAGLLAQMIVNSDLIVCHNVSFDRILICKMLHDNGMENMAATLWERDDKWFCTMYKSTDYCQLPGRFGRYKWPKLIELYQKLFSEDFEGAHDALADIRATMRCYYEMEKRGLI